MYPLSLYYSEQEVVTSVKKVTLNVVGQAQQGNNSSNELLPSNFSSQVTKERRKRKAVGANPLSVAKPSEDSNRQQKRKMNMIKRQRRS